jgi:hypothetical protein
MVMKIWVVSHHIFLRLVDYIEIFKKHLVSIIENKNYYMYYNKIFKFKKNYVENDK